MSNLDEELDEIFYQYRDDYNAWQANPRGSGTNGIKLQAKAKQAIQSLITTQKQELLSEIEKELEPKLRRLYYHDPDELGEDAFNNLGDDEVEEVLAIITTKREEV